MATGSGDLTEDRGATKSKVSELLELQSSDHPGMVLVSTPLNGRNYMAWSRAMRIALGAKMKLGFITGKCVRPDENSDDFEKWMRVDCMVTSWLLNSISKDIVDAFLYTASAHDLWTELEQRFGECNGPLLYQIQREIASISQGALSVTGYFTKLKQLWDELTYLAPVPHCNCEYSRTVVDYATSNQLMQFLMGLNDIYDHVRNQILVTDPLPNVNKAYSMILRVEKHGKLICLYMKEMKELQCLLEQIHGIPDWYKDLTEQRKKDGTGGRVFNVQTSDNRAETEAHSTSDATSVSEIVRMELMKFMRGLAPAEQQPETRSDEYAVTQSGTICLNDKISLAHVLYVPFFHNNLISVSKLCVDSNIALEFLPTHCILQDRMTEEVLAVARQTNRLYILDPSSFSRNLIDMHCSKLSCKVFHVAHGDVFLWHQRLGRPSFKTLQHVKGFSSSVLTDNTICDVCPMAKQSRLPFQTSTSKSSTLFELIHIDLWGPYKHASLSGCHFFLTIVDDYSRTTWTYLLKHKSQAVPLLETYLQMVQTQFDAKCGQKAFKLYDLNNHSVIISRDVVFHEQNFPFSTSVLPDLTATPLPLVSLTDDPLMLSNPNPQLTDVPEQSHLPHSTSTDLHFSSSSSELNPSLPHDEATSLPSPVILSVGLLDNLITSLDE
ncbi:UNVERIFIED_CONTAM: Retrovirus-related Pol polyprotein from transposon RE2 [Sesamum radiatum]|uniref:Retrovirus-related Pol polyprotein from transposon RE2 n=1 Tax=Sesamum radiatum TaxID=300843 RepID=A0AAW2P8D1_SESRA